MTLVDSIRPWGKLIFDTATSLKIDPWLVAGVVSIESEGNQYAQRVERGFWTRYAAGIARWVTASASTSDDNWARYPDVYASSYGLMQVLLQSAAEAGFTYRYPGELFDPERNLRIGCALLARHLRAAGGDQRQALLKYNGGEDAAYPDRVFARRSQLIAVGAI